MTPIPLFKVSMENLAGNRVNEVLRSGYIGQGERCKELEYEFWRSVWPEEPSPRPPLLVNSCTSAIDLALHLIGVGPGDRVVTTPQTCTATNSPIVTRGAIPVWADVDPVTGLIDTDWAVSLAARTQAKAIIAVDWAGRICDYGALKRAGVPVIQDAAHRGPMPFPDGVVLGDYICWSTQAIKFLTTGDGGFLAVPPAQYERAKLLRWYGLDRETSADFRCAQDIKEVGYKYQSNDIAASVGLANMERAKRAVERHQTNAEWLWGNLNQHPFPGGRFQMPPFDPFCHYWMFPALVDDREGFQAHMLKRGISTSEVHRRNDGHTAFSMASGEYDYGAVHRPGLDSFSARQVNIPCGWWLTDDDLSRIVEAVESWVRPGG